MHAAQGPDWGELRLETAVTGQGQFGALLFGVIVTRPPPVPYRMDSVVAGARRVSGSGVVTVLWLEARRGLRAQVSVAVLRCER